MKRLIAIVQFMTTIPIKLDTGIDKEFHKGLIYFPIVGLILGVIYYLIGVITNTILPNNITAIIIVISEVVLTGGLHLDGVGDSFDGLYSYRDKDRILEIMKDSRLGTNGMVAIVIVLILKIVLTNNIVDSGELWIIAAMPVVARTMQVVACYKTKTPRKNGMGNIFIGKISTLYMILTILSMYAISCLLILALGYTEGSLFSIDIIISTILVQISVVAVLIIWTRLFVRSVYKKIDGITGDILGCISEITEVIYLLVMTILMSNALFN